MEFQGTNRMLESVSSALKMVEALKRRMQDDSLSKLSTFSSGDKVEYCPLLVQNESPHSFDGYSKTYVAPKQRGITLALPLFDGQDCSSFESWLFKVECYFEHECFSDEWKFNLILPCIVGHALKWYMRVKGTRKRKGKAKIRTWTKLKKHLKSQFLSMSNMSESQFQLENAKQDVVCVIKSCVKQMESIKCHGSVSLEPESIFVETHGKRLMKNEH